MEVLLRFNEVALKGANRGWFEKVLGSNAKSLVIRESEDNLKGNIKYHWLGSRLMLRAPWNESTQRGLERTFGLVGFTPVTCSDTQADAIYEKALENFEEHVTKFGVPASFRVKCRRAEKAIPEKSKELELRIGSEICKRYPQIKVKMTDAQTILGIEVRKVSTLIWSSNFKGPGGLPVGSNSPVLTLLSGGLDSPIAALRMMKRGSHSHFIHFDGAPFVGQDALEKVKDLAHHVGEFSPSRAKLYVVPFGAIQEKVALATDARARTLLYRRLMFRIASEVANRIQALALVTGESLGQVASQTMENMVVVDQAASIPVLRPLVGMDKDEIIREARYFKTYDISNRPGEDCCTLFADKHPILKARFDYIEKQEKLFALEEFVQEALNQVQKV